jgi:hypothetical protein
MGKLRNSYRIVRKPEEKKELGRSRQVWENIEMNLKEKI